MTKREVLAVVLAVWVIVVGCGHRKPIPVEGTWVVAKIGDTSMPMGKAGYPEMKLVLNPDGTFTDHTESHIMMDLVVDTKGTYKVSGKKLILEGRMTSMSDDGYKKSKSEMPIKLEMSIENWQLVRTLGGTKTVYIRKGTKMAAEP